MGYINLSIGKGNLLMETSKTPAEGFTENKWEMDDRSGINYKKVHKNISGTLDRFQVKEAPYQQGLDLVSIGVKNGEDIYTLDFELAGYKGEGINDWVAAFGPYYYALQPGMDIEINLNTTSMKKADKKGVVRPWKSVYLQSNGEKISWEYDPVKDTPPWEKIVTKNAVGKEKETWDRGKQDDFISEKLKAALDRFETVTQPTETKVSEKVTEMAVSEDAFDELPF